VNPANTFIGAMRKGFGVKHYDDEKQPRAVM
jgi:hypothetical protein